MHHWNAPSKGVTLKPSDTWRTPGTLNLTTFQQHPAQRMNALLINQFT
jgi:hypothetical protein